MVIDFELRAWLMRNLSEGHESKKHSLARRDLIEINSVQLDVLRLSRQGMTIAFLPPTSMTWRAILFFKAGYRESCGRGWQRRALRESMRRPRRRRQAL
jgi:hypothetical protein